MHYLRLTTASLVALLSAALPAQTVHFVPPGAPTWALQMAVNAAAPGDIIRVAANRSDWLDVDKPLTILAEPGAILGTLQSFPPFHIRVRNIPAGASCTVRGFEIFADPYAGTPWIDLHNCAGHVLIEDVAARSVGNAFLVSIANCASVVLNRLTSFVTWQESIWAVDANVTLVNCDIDALGLITSTVPNPRGAIRATRSSMTIAQCKLTARNMRNWLNLASFPDTLIVLEDSHLYLSGDGSAPLTLPSPAVDVFIDAINSSVVVDAGLPLPGPIVGTVATTANVPTVLASPAPLGGSHDVAILSAPGTTAALFLGLAGPCSELGSFNNYCFATSPLLASLAVVPPSGSLAITIPVPNIPWLVALPFAWHAVTWSPSGGNGLSNVAPLTLH